MAGGQSLLQQTHQGECCLVLAKLVLKANNQLTSVLFSLVPNTCSVLRQSFGTGWDKVANSVQLLPDCV